MSVVKASFYTFLTTNMVPSNIFKPPFHHRINTQIYSAVNKHKKLTHKTFLCAALACLCELQ